MRHGEQRDQPPARVDQHDRRGVLDEVRAVIRRHAAEICSAANRLRDTAPAHRLHLSSLDWHHGFSLQPTNINVQVHPGYELVMTVQPDRAGEYSVVCNEFCGIGNHLMVGKIHVTE